MNAASACGGKWEDALGVVRMEEAEEEEEVADGLASIAGNPRTPRPELLAAVSGLCRLGHAHARRASHLLLNWHRSRSRCTSSSGIKELVRAGFSSILQASASFATLHGHRPSDSDPDLARWAREEMQHLSVAFCGLARSSMSMTSTSVSHTLASVLDAATCAVSYCSLLTRRVIIRPPAGADDADDEGAGAGGWEQEWMELTLPCLQEVLAMYAAHLKAVLPLLLASDSWVLGSFLLPLPPTLLTSPTTTTTEAAVDQRPHYCLLTTSGRKFLTLLQEAVGDVSPLLNLGMKSSAVQLLAELCREYMHSSVLEAVVPVPPPAADSGEQRHHMRQLSVLINCTTLLSLFPIVARGIFNHSSAASPLSVSAADCSMQSELDSLTSSIKQAAGQVWACFCHQFIRDTMSSTQQTTPAASSGGGGISPQGMMMMMPSSAFQALFLRVMQLNNLYGAILNGKDGTMEKLLQELMQAMILWLSNNLDHSTWIHQSQSECVPKDMLFDQIQLDIHFLLELAQVGGFSSDDIASSALALLRKAQEKMPCLEPDGIINSGKEGWAADAAKHAVQVLMGTHDHRSGSHQEAASIIRIENGNGVIADQMARDREEIDDSCGHQDSMLESWSNDEHGCSSVDEAGACKSSTDEEFISVEEEEGSNKAEDGDSANGNRKLLLKDRAMAVGDEVLVHYYWHREDSQVAGVAAAVSDDACSWSGCGPGGDDEIGSGSPEPELMQAGGGGGRLPLVAVVTSSSRSRKKRSSRPRWQ